MTVEERLERIEQLHAEQMEMSRRDRAEHIAWKRDMESRVEATWIAIDRMATENRRMAQDNRDGFAELREQMRETDRHLKELGAATDARIERLVVAIGELIKARNGSAE